MDGISMRMVGQAYGVKDPAMPGRLEPRGWTSAQRPDTVEFSREAQVAGAVRTALIARIKAQITAGAYDTRDKLDAALDKLIRQVE